MDSLLSIVLPVFNQSRFLSGAIQSVFSQNYQNWELIIVDDGSNDHPEQVIEKYRDPRIRLIRQENRGLSAARNRGIRASTGALIAFLDADDLWKPELLELLSQHLCSDPHLGMAFCFCDYINEKGKFLCSGPRPPYQRIKDVTEFWVIRTSPHGCGSSFMIRKEVFNLIGDFDESLQVYEDNEYFIRILRNSKFRISGIDRSLVQYRVHSNSLSKNYSLLTECLSRMITKEEDRRVSLAFLNRYIMQRAMLTSGPRIIIISRLLKCLLSWEPWRVDFLVTFHTFLGGLIYLIAPRRVFFTILRMRSDHA